MRYSDTLKRCVMYVFAGFPDSTFESTPYAVAIGAVKSVQGGLTYLEVLQDLAAYRPELLDCLAVMDSSPTNKGQGTISFADDAEALFVFRESS